MYSRREGQSGIARGLAGIIGKTREVVPMDVIEWLSQIGKLNQMIDAKIAERDQIRLLATNTVGNLDGMPHAPGISDKVGNLAVKLVALDEEINALVDQYVDRRQEAIQMLERLPEREYGVLHRYYIRGMTWEQVADDMGYCTTQIWRIKKNGLKLLQDAIECNVKVW
jgi:DNA-directed RNA polymerase specialized sigma24 family protein